MRLNESLRRRDVETPVHLEIRRRLSPLGERIAVRPEVAAVDLRQDSKALEHRYEAIPLGPRFGTQEIRRRGSDQRGLRLVGIRPVGARCPVEHL